MIKQLLEAVQQPKPGSASELPMPAQKGKTNPYEQMLADPGWLLKLQSSLSPPVVDVKLFTDGDELAKTAVLVTVPDDWPHVQLAPFYDAHVGSNDHDEQLFAEHIQWAAETPYVLTWNGGDFIENANKLSPGSGVYRQMAPQEQIASALYALATIRHKTLFSLAGNHEDRIEQLGIDASQWIAQMLGIPYFPGYCLCRIVWRGNAFSVLAHHGSGYAQTAGAQLTNIRKELPWAHGFDLYWFGHLHQSIHQQIERVVWPPDLAQPPVYRSGYAIMSPSYLKYFGGGYAEKKRLPIASRGMTTVILRASGRIDLEQHARGARF